MIAPLALTLGEPAGIGPDLALTTWLHRGTLGVPPFYLLADPAFVIRRTHALGFDVPVTTVTPGQAGVVFPHALPVVDIGLAVTALPGTPDPSSAPAALAAIDQAVTAVLAGEASAVVTNPIAKSVLYQAGFSEPGHTEYLAKLTTQATRRAVLPVMMIWSPELAVVPVTIHVPLSHVPGLLTRDLIAATGRVAAHDYSRRFGIAAPRIAVAGLNPHAGESGTIGTEDRDVVAPAVAVLAAEGFAVRGPLPADTLFYASARATYDIALCMYHDQALIPAKTLAFDHAVNVTLGLPFVRTSPDHGTAFDLAGTGRADPASLIAALKLAARLAAAERPVAAAAE
jgi:4-hydroxythreonine-4-phosphate dehydrogenase